MAALPVESMKMGGLFWFTDLTVPDPFYILPVASCFAFLLNIEVKKFTCTCTQFQSLYICTGSKASLQTVQNFNSLFFQLGGEVGVGNPQVEKMKTFFRIMAFLMIPITATFPSVSLEQLLLIAVCKGFKNMLPLMCSCLHLIMPFSFSLGFVHVLVDVFILLTGTGTPP